MGYPIYEASRTGTGDRSVEQTLNYSVSDAGENLTPILEMVHQSVEMQYGYPIYESSRGGTATGMRDKY